MPEGAGEGRDVKMTKNKRRHRGHWSPCRTRRAYDSLPEVKVEDLEAHLHLSRLVTAAVVLRVDGKQIPRCVAGVGTFTLSKEGAVALLSRSRRAHIARNAALCGKA